MKRNLKYVAVALALVLFVVFASLSVGGILTLPGPAHDVAVLWRSSPAASGSDVAVMWRSNSTAGADDVAVLWRGSIQAV
jgi:hypothetical protein